MERSREYSSVLKPALLFVFAGAIFGIRADVQSQLSRLSNFTKIPETRAAEPDVRTSRSIEFHGSDEEHNLSRSLENFIPRSLISFSFLEEIRRWNDFVLEVVKLSPSFHYENVFENSPDMEARFSLKVFSEAGEIATIENFNSAAGMADLHIFLGYHMRVREIPSEKIPQALKDIAFARERCRQPFGKIKKMSQPFIKIAGCLTGIMRALAKYGIVETEP